MATTSSTGGFPDWLKYVFLAVTSVSVGVLSYMKLVPNHGKSQKDKSNDLDAKMKALEARKPSNLWNTALFFPDFHAESPDSTTQQFLWYFQQARTSILICIYNFSFPELELIIRKQYERGLIVQFVVGQEATANNLRNRGIPCGHFPRDPNVPKTDQLMHHKIAVIDDEAVLVGSMNWTTEGILNNNENICVTTNPATVKKYLMEFVRLMKICEKAKTFY